MTQRSAREARIHLISEGVIASYINEISTGTAVSVPAATARRQTSHGPRRARAVSEPGARARSRHRGRRRRFPAAARA